MLPSDAKKLVEKIHQQRYHCDANATSLANTLDTNIHTVFSSQRKFLYELLQNADDAEAKRVCFSLVDDHIVIAHDGLRFDAQDVVRLCDNAQVVSVKTQSMAKTGYKGVGFKSVFCVSEKITVYSHPFSFRFEKPQTTPGQQGRYPWQIIPIWTEPETVAQKLNNDFPWTVQFILEQVDRDCLHAELQELLSSSELLLLLRHVESIETPHNQQRVTKTQRKADHYQLTKQRAAEEPCVDIWRLSRLETTVPSVVRQNLVKLSLSECPEKIKQAQRVCISFAAKVQEDVLVPHPDAQLYCYLPTQVKTGFPFLINADFILNQDRTLLLDNAWNDFLFERIGTLYFDWLAELAQSDYALSLLGLVHYPNVSGVVSAWVSAFKAGFAAGLKRTAFIPSKTPGRLLTFEQAVHDSSEFFTMPHDSLHPQPFQDAHGSCLIAPEAEGVEALYRLKEHGWTLNEFGLPQLIDQLSQYAQQSEGPQFCLTVLHFFRTRPGIDDALLRRLAAQKFIYTDKQRYCAIEDCFIPEQSKVGEVFALDVVHPSVASDHRVCRWLRDRFDRPSLKPLEIIRKHIIVCIETGRVNEHNTDIFMRYLYSSYSRGIKLTGADYQKLSKIPVFVDEGRKLLPIMFAYWPEESLTQKMDVRLARSFIRETDDEARWKALLVKMGVNTNIGLTLNLKGSAAEVTVDEILQYLKNIGQVADFHAYYQAIYHDNRGFLHKSTPGANHKIQNFITFDFFDRIKTEPSYYEQFWSAFKRQWSEVKKPVYYDKVTRSSPSKKKVEPYLSFYMNHNRCFRVQCAKGRTTPTRWVDGPTLLHLADAENVDLSCLDILDIPVALNPAQIFYFGFRGTPTLEECLALLSSSKNSHKPPALKTIYGWLLSLEKIDKDTIQRWSEAQYLLSCDGSTRKISDLCFNDLGLKGIPRSDRLHEVDLTEDDVKKLVEMFGITRLSQLTPTVKPSCGLVAHSKKQWQKFVEDVLVFTLPVAAIDMGGDEKAKYIHQFANKFVWLGIELCSTLKIGAYPAPVFIAGSKLLINEKPRLKTFSDILALALTRYFDLSRTAGDLLKQFLQGAINCTNLEIDNSKAVAFLEEQDINEGEHGIVRDKFLKSIAEERDCSARPIQTQVGIDEAVNRVPHQITEPQLRGNDAIVEAITFATGELTINATATDATDVSAKEDSFNGKEPQPTQPSSTVSSPESAPGSPVMDPDSRPSPHSPQRTPPSSPAMLASHHEAQSPHSPAFTRVVTSPQSSPEKILRAPGNREGRYATSVRRPRATPSAERQTQLKALGNAGESLVYEKLLELMQVAIKRAPLQNDSGAYFTLDDNREVHILWYLKNLEQGQDEGPVDIRIELRDPERDATQVLYNIEVKTTNIQNNQRFFISPNEWAYMVKQPDQSVLVRVCIDPNGNGSTVLPIRNPFKLIKKGLIMLAANGAFEFQLPVGDAIPPACQCDDYTDPVTQCRVS